MCSLRSTHSVDFLVAPSLPVLGWAQGAAVPRSAAADDGLVRTIGVLEVLGALGLILPRSPASHRPLHQRRLSGSH